MNGFSISRMLLEAGRFLCGIVAGATCLVILAATPGWSQSPAEDGFARARVLIDRGELLSAQQKLDSTDVQHLSTQQQIEYWELQTLASIRQGDADRAAAALGQLLASQRARSDRDTAQQFPSKERPLRVAAQNSEQAARLHTQAAVQAAATESRAQAMHAAAIRGMTAAAALAALISGSMLFRGWSQRRHDEQVGHQQQLLNAELQRVVQNQTETLRREMESRRQLQNALHHKQRHEALGKLTGGVAHDFNNLLTAIINSNNTLRQLLADHRNPRVLELLGASDEAAKSGAEIVKGLLAYARRQSLHATPVELPGYLTSTRGLFHSVLGDGMQLQTVNRLAPGTAIVVDPGQLTTSLLNLLSNARDACRGHGCVTLTLTAHRLPDPRVEASADLPPGAYVRLAVNDDGCGMSRNVLSRAFEPFYSSKTPPAGTGLGLSVVYGFAKQSHGDVQIASSPAGTCVALLFPLSHCNEKPLPDASPEPKGGGERVLVVDDNQLVRGATARLLAAYGFEASEAADAAAAMQLVESGTIPDVVLTDVVMPGNVDGIGLAIWLHDHCPQVQVVLCSGYALEYRQSNRHWLTKPYTTQELIDTLRRSLAAKTAAAATGG